MSEKPSSFCPPECLFSGVPKMCTEDCIHSRDVIYEKPKKVEIRYAGKWEVAEVLGESMGKYYIRRSNGDIFSTVMNSPLVR